MHMKKIRAGNEETYKEDNKNLFKSKKTTYNKRVASKIEVADWELKVVVLERSAYGLLLPVDMTDECICIASVVPHV